MAETYRDPKTMTQAEKLAEVRGRIVSMQQDADKLIRALTYEEQVTLAKWLGEGSRALTEAPENVRRIINVCASVTFFGIWTIIREAELENACPKP